MYITLVFVLFITHVVAIAAVCCVFRKLIYFFIWCTYSFPCIFITTSSPFSSTACPLFICMYVCIALFIHSFSQLFICAYNKLNHIQFFFLLLLLLLCCIFCYKECLIMQFIYRPILRNVFILWVLFCRQMNECKGNWFLFLFSNNVLYVFVYVGFCIIVKWYI